MLNGVIFDMDGVLVDSHPAHLYAWSKLITETGRAVPNDDLQIVLDGRKRGDILGHFFRDFSEERIRELGALKDSYFAEASHLLSLMPGVMRFLNLLTAAGLRVAVATSASKVRASELLDRFSLRHKVEVLVTGDDVERGKPDPAIFQLSAKALGLQPQAVVVFEDAVSGIRAAKSAGMLPIGIASGSRSERLLDAGAVMVVPDFTGLQLSDICSIAGLSAKAGMQPSLPGIHAQVASITAPIGWPY